MTLKIPLSDQEAGAEGKKKQADLWKTFGNGWGQDEVGRRLDYGDECALIWFSWWVVYNG